MAPPMVTVDGRGWDTEGVQRIVDMMREALDRSREVPKHPQLDDSYAMLHRLADLQGYSLVAKRTPGE